jgi:hypothetical protein
LGLNDLLSGIKIIIEKKNYNVQIGLLDTRYSSESGARAEAIIAQSISNTGAYSWTIPQSVGTMDLKKLPF